MGKLNQIKEELPNLSVKEMFELSESLISEFKSRCKEIDRNTITSKVVVG